MIWMWIGYSVFLIAVYVAMIVSYRCGLRGVAERIEELEKQLPEGMQDCTIRFVGCPTGHGRLTADNWTDAGCHWCKITALETVVTAVVEFEKIYQQPFREIEKVASEKMFDAVAELNKEE